MTSKARNNVNKLNDIVNIKDYGAVSDGVTNVAPSIQAAHDALSADGGAIYVPGEASSYKWETTVNFTKPVHFFGDARFASRFLTTSSNLNLLTVSQYIVMERMSFFTTGASVKVIAQPSTAGTHNLSKFRDLLIQDFASFFDTEGANAFIFDSCFFGGCDIALDLFNANNTDTGDSHILNCHFAIGQNQIGVLVRGTAGINVVGNKFIAPVDVANKADALFAIRATGPVGNFLFSANSFEGQADYAIDINGSATSTKNIITGNQFSGGFQDAIIRVGAGAANTLISSNSFNDVNQANGLAIDVKDTSLTTLIEGNLFHQINTAIRMGTICTDLSVKNNKYVKGASVTVTNILTGNITDYNSTLKPNHISIDHVVYTQNASDTNWVDVFTITGNYYDLKATTHYILQGVGFGTEQLNRIFNGSASSVLIADYETGANIDFEHTSGGVVRVKRPTASGTLFTGEVAVNVSGFINSFVVN